MLVAGRVRDGPSLTHQGAGTLRAWRGGSVTGVCSLLVSGIASRRVITRPWASQRSGSDARGAKPRGSSVLLFGVSAIAEDRVLRHGKLTRWLSK